MKATTKTKTKKLLVVIDMQYDFIDGSLANTDAKAIVPNVVKKIDQWTSDVVFTMDAHDRQYLSTREGRYLPVEHCQTGSKGFGLDHDVYCSIARKFAGEDSVQMATKHTFGFDNWRKLAGGYREIEIVGLCTDVCVVSNALMLRSLVPEANITVDASCCAGTTPDAHEAALTVMKSCHINVINDD
jgi:nicotinamidase-related amidase